MSKLILASGSPRRKELLTAAGVRFEVKVSDIDETPLKNEPPHKMVQRLSLEKSAAVAQDLKLKGDYFILAADTTVVTRKGKNLGKPESEKEAFQMLSELQGDSHFVFTAYAILKIRNSKIIKRKVRLVKTVVTFKSLTRKEIQYYINRGESMDKAGAYGAQGSGMMLVEKISGSFTNVIGLPLSQVLDDFKKWGITSHVE